jgi:hypothetical protein
VSLDVWGSTVASTVDETVSAIMSGSWTRLFRRCAIAGIVFPALTAATLTLFHVLANVVHIDLGSVGPIGVFAGVFLFYIAVVVSLGSAVVVCRLLWSWST